jgi:hypothetical protein
MTELSFIVGGAHGPDCFQTNGDFLSPFFFPAGNSLRRPKEVAT